MAELLLEKFKINNKCQLNSEDISSLTLLYLPLIGLDSLALYQTLCTINDEEEHTFKELINVTTIQTLSNLNKAFEKIEGIGLLKTYYNKEKGYLFDIISPLKEKEFIAEEMLMALLETQIGLTEIEKLKSKVKSVNRLYKDVTKKFSEVYTVTTKSEQNVIANILSPTIIVENPEFNYSLFRMLFDSTYIDEAVLNDEEFKKNIIRLSFVYKLNEEELKDIVFKTIDNDKKCDYPSLSKNARIVFQKKYKVDSPKIVTIKEDEYIQSLQDDVVIRFCNDLETKSPSEILETLSGMKPTPSELKIAEDLLKNTNLTVGAINFMLMYVSKEREGELPSYNYFEKIASTWSRGKVKTALDAIRYTEKKNKTVKEQKEVKPRQKKNAPVPEWYSEYEKNLQATETKNPKTSEEVLDLAKNLFED